MSDAKHQQQSELAEAIRGACVKAALAAYEEGGVSGLCEEGRWELAIDAIRKLDLNDVLRDAAHRVGGRAGSTTT